jgi:hypothetical protein
VLCSWCWRLAAGRCWLATGHWPLVLELTTQKERGTREGLAVSSVSVLWPLAFGLLVWLIAQPLLNSGAGAVPCACACAARFSPPPAPHPSTSNSSTCSTCSAPAAAPQGKPSGVQGGRGAPVHAKTWGAWCATNASYGKLPKPHENLGFNTIFPETQKVRHSLNGPTYCTHAHIRYEKVIVPFKVHLSGFAFS